MRDPKRPNLSSQLVTGTIPTLLMIPVVLGGQYLWFIGAGPVAVGFLVLAGGGLCLWLGHRQRKSHRAKIEAGVFDTDNVLYSDASVSDYINLFFSCFYGAWSTFLFQGTVGTTVALEMSMLGYIFLGSTFAWSVWMLATDVVIPVSYDITSDGIWSQWRMIPFYISFDDVECVHYQPGFRIVWPSQYNKPVVRFSRYVVVEIKKEVKLYRESHRKYLTPSNPHEFLSHLPQELVRMPDQG